MNTLQIVLIFLTPFVVVMATILLPAYRAPLMKAVRGVPGAFAEIGAHLHAFGQSVLAQHAIAQAERAPADAPAPRGVTHPPHAAWLAILNHIGKTLRGSPTVLTGWCIPIILIYTFVIASWYGKPVDLTQTVALIVAMGVQASQRVLTKKVEASAAMGGSAGVAAG